MTAGAIISYSWDPRVGCECYAQEQYEWGCSTREEKLGVGGGPSTGHAIPDLVQSPVAQEQ